MSFDVVALDVLLLLGAALLVWWSRKMWHNEAPASDSANPSAWWPWWWGPRAWRGWVRTQGLVVPLVVIPLAVVLVVDSTGATGLAAQLILTLGFLLTVFGAVAAPIVVLFNRPKRLVAPHLRHQPGLVAERLGERPEETPPPRGSDPRLAGRFGPFLGVVVLLALAGLLVWACTVALVPALVAAVVSGVVAASLVRAGQAAGRIPVRWEGWEEAPRTLSTVSIVVQLIFAGGLIYVWEHSTSNSVAAAAMGVLTGTCLAFASTGLRLTLEHRRRPPPADARSDET